MTIRNLDAAFRPGTVAIIGATARAPSIGRVLLENLRGAGFAGRILPVNPKHTEVLGLPAFPNVASLPETPDLAVIATPAATVPDLVRDARAARHARSGDHFGRIPGRRRTRAVPGRARCGSPAAAARHRAEHARHRRSGDRLERKLRAAHAAARQSRIRRAIRRDCDVRAGLGVRARHRFFAPGFARRHGGRRLRRHARLPRE